LLLLLLVAQTGSALPTPSLPALEPEILDGLTGPESHLDLTYTYHMSKYSCLRPMYYIHMFLVYSVFTLGILCCLTRLWAPLKPLHKWLGKAYIVCMTWATACAMLIKNEGLAAGVWTSFVIVLICMGAGWFAIKGYQGEMQEQAEKLVGRWIGTGKIDPANYPLLQAINEAKARLAMKKDAYSRVFSLKAVHGALMLVSWVAFAPRIFLTGLNPEFTCFSFPAYKPRNASVYRTRDLNLEGIWPMQLLPEVDVDASGPWVASLPRWTVMISATPIGFGLLIGALYSYYASPKAVEQNELEIPIAVDGENSAQHEVNS